jgi:hypothetical protein
VTDRAPIGPLQPDPQQGGAADHRQQQLQGEQAHGEHHQRSAQAPPAPWPAQGDRLHQGWIRERGRCHCCHQIGPEHSSGEGREPTEGIAHKHRRSPLGDLRYLLEKGTHLPGPETVVEGSLALMSWLFGASEANQVEPIHAVSGSGKGLGVVTPMVAACTETMQEQQRST